MSSSILEGSYRSRRLIRYVIRLCACRLARFIRTDDSTRWPLQQIISVNGNNETTGMVTVGSLGLDLTAGATLASRELYGDWYRDPWSWPELGINFAKGLDVEADLLLGRTAGGEYHLTHRPVFHLVDVPKTWLGVRPAVVQDPLSRLAYLSATQAGLDKLHSSLPDWVYGWRRRGDNIVASGGPEWAAYVASLPSTDTQNWGLLTDITSFFASIRPERLERLVYGRLGKVAAAHIIMDVVRAHDSLSARSGLPQRSFASAVLAHALLQPVDDALAAALVTANVIAVRRWMDDISAEGDAAALYALLMDLQERARQVGLELNSSKTHLSPSAQTVQSLRLEDLREIGVPVTAIAAGDYSDEVQFVPDLDLLHSLESSLLANPTGFPRTVAKATLVSLTKNNQFSRQEQWRSAAHMLPHVADNLGRYLRGAAEADPSLWPIFGEWFYQYQAYGWGRLDWVSAQFALAFPATHLPPPVMRVLQRWLESSASLQQVAIAVQRICTVNPALGRNLIRARVDRIVDPLLLRVLALGLLMAGDNEGIVRGVLARDPHNHLLLRYLEATRWQPPTVAKDFDVSVTDDLDL